MPFHCIITSACQKVFGREEVLITDTYEIMNEHYTGDSWQMADSCFSFAT